MSENIAESIVEITVATGTDNDGPELRGSGLLRGIGRYIRQSRLELVPFVFVGSVTLRRQLGAGAETKCGRSVHKLR